MHVLGAPINGAQTSGRLRSRKRPNGEHRYEAFAVAPQLQQQLPSSQVRSICFREGTYRDLTKGQPQVNEHLRLIRILQVFKPHHHSHIVVLHYILSEKNGELERR